MSQLPASQAIIRLKENEERFDFFLNTNAGYNTNELVPREVKGIPYIMMDILSRIGPKTVSHTTSSLAQNEIEEFQIVMAKVSSLTKITTDRKAWIRVYGTEADLIADRTRLITESPDPIDHVIWDVSTYDNLTVRSCPIPIFANGDSPVVDIAYVSVKNIDASAGTITCDMDYIGGSI